jgi:aspartate racemase
MGEYMHPEVSMHTYPLGDYMVHIESGNWKEVAELMLSSAEKLARVGADFAICPDNTIHQAFDIVSSTSPIPWLHIADGIVQEAKSNGFKKLGIMGTKYLMTGPVYPEFLAKHGMSAQIPDIEDRETINTIIFKELVNGVLLEESRQWFNEVIQKLKDQGCDGVVLGCTEIPLIVKPDDCPLPTLDSTRLLARHALKEAINGE